MRVAVCVAIGLFLAFASAEQQQQVLRRVSKSVGSQPTSGQSSRVRVISVRSSQPQAQQQPGAVTEISQREAVSFGQRTGNETSGATKNAKTPVAPVAIPNPTSTTSTSTTSTTSTSTSTTTSTPSPSSSTSTTSTTEAPKSPAGSHKASERQQLSPSGAQEVELLVNAPSWQSMAAVEAPAAMLIATGLRRANSDLVVASSEAEASDFLRSSSAAKGGATVTQHQQRQSSRLRSSQQQQQAYFYPSSNSNQQSQQLRVGKTSQAAVKGHWYQQPPTTTTTTTSKPVIVQQEVQQQEHENYVEEYGQAPVGQAEPFAFDFKTDDSNGNGQYRREQSDSNGVVKGSYGYTDANGIYRHVEYVADHNGFRANIKSNEPGLQGTDTQPASIQMQASGAAPASPATSGRLAAASHDQPELTHHQADNVDWSSVNNNNQPSSSSADLALVSPDFESAHKPERLRARRNFRN